MVRNRMSPTRKKPSARKGTTAGTRASPARQARRASIRGTSPRRVATNDSATATIEVRTPNKKGYVGRVNRDKYEAMRDVLLRVLPSREPGVTQSEMMAAVLAEADKSVFPKTTAMWWAKSVQLDLEAQGLVVRDGGKPLRWRKARDKASHTRDRG